MPVTQDSGLTIIGPEAHGITTPTPLQIKVRRIITGDNNNYRLQQDHLDWETTSAIKIANLPVSLASDVLNELGATGQLPASFTTQAVEISFGEKKGLVHAGNTDQTVTLIVPEAVITNKRNELVGKGRQ